MSIGNGSEDSDLETASGAKPRQTILALALVLVLVSCAGVQVNTEAIACSAGGGTWQTSKGGASCWYPTPEPTPTPAPPPTTDCEGSPPGPVCIAAGSRECWTCSGRTGGEWIFRQPWPVCQVAERVPTFCRQSAGVPPASWVRLDPSWIFPDDARVCEPNDVGGCWHHPASGWEYLAKPEPTPEPTPEPEPTPDSCKPTKRYVEDNAPNDGVRYKDCQEWRDSVLAPGATEVTGWPAKHGWSLEGKKGRTYAGDHSGHLHHWNETPSGAFVMDVDRACDVGPGYKNGDLHNDPTPERSRVLLGIRGYWVEDPCVEEPEPTGACYAGPWRMECKFDSCEIPNDDLPDTVNGRDYGAAARDAIAGVIADGFPVDDSSRIDEALDDVFAASVVERLRGAGWCAAGHGDDPRVSPDEIALWPRGDAPPWKEHLDVCVASGQPAGECLVGPGTRGLTARGWR